ncbi:MAG: hypothetical protein A2142_07585 [candidate division Zixibacteria bacterium RBG_16_48_11]|nr:MAG: hypothetical protein A2142_07585 [candidate division Zixibacteria bacterium RBG_16_48_11]
MQQEERHAVIASILEMLKNQRKYQGKVVLQKLFYFLEEGYGVSLPYQFRFYHYGPYSSELDKDLRVMQMFNIIDIKNDPEETGYTIELKAGAQANEYLQKGKSFLKEHEGQISKVLELFGSETPAMLELLGTVYYVYKDAEKSEATKQSIVKKVKALKPKFEDSEIDSYYNYLVVAKLIKQ